jgi:hypothetical protein
VSNDDAVLKAKEFEFIKKLAVEAPDFVGRLKGLESQQVDRLTVGALIETTNTYAAETSTVLEGYFKEGFKLQTEYVKLKHKHNEYSQEDSLFLPLWANQELMYTNFMLGYQKALQVNALIMQINVKLADALINAYGGTALSASEAAQLGEAAKKIRQVATLLEGLDKLAKAKTKEA